ncbi:MAG: asparagine synthetase B [Candidatus Marinimicrobia bacterium]|nr:asparagine synthetase B [Candidatus Neomarinimicrobiota bacterium]
MKKFILFFFLLVVLKSEKILIPMDISQKDHLKAYGVIFWCLENNTNVEWILNYKGGSFLIDYKPFIINETKIRGVSTQIIQQGELNEIFNVIESENMEIVLLEKAPKIAVYTPPNKQPWDDAVTLALTYAEIKYETLWDKEVFDGQLNNFDWLHLHHEDFTGQFGKFYRNFRNAPWYIEQKNQYERLAKDLGFKSVSEQKKNIAVNIKNYIGNGGFLFAMCSATDSYDIALSAIDLDIVDQLIDNTPIDENINQLIDFNKTLAFENFKIITNPLIYEFSNIDFPPSDNQHSSSAEKDYFTLFEFSAKFDPVPTMLTQNHVDVIKGFMGQTTGFERSTIKKHVTILGEVENQNQIKYIHGNFGKGTFTFLGGHDPEDYQHYVGDPPTDLALHRNSPGYRLILNNILFPAAKKKPRKT